MDEYTFFWLTGDAEVLKGDSENNALNSAGYGFGALRALDFYGQGDIRDKYTFDKKLSRWVVVNV